MYSLKSTHVKTLPMMGRLKVFLKLKIFSCIRWKFFNAKVGKISSIDKSSFMLSDKSTFVVNYLSMNMLKSIPLVEGSYMYRLKTTLVLKGFPLQSLISEWNFCIQHEIKLVNRHILV